MVDRQTVDFIRATGLPEPSQAALDELLGETTSITLLELGTGGGVPVLTVETPAAVASVRSALRLDQRGLGHLLAAASHRLECRAGDLLVASLELAGLSVLRWPGRWRSDALLADVDAVADAFARLGYAALRRWLDEARVAGARREAERAAWERTWDAVTPAGLAEVVPTLLEEQYAPASPVRDEALRVLAAGYPSVEAQVLALLAWYGHSLGPWSGFPWEESAAEYLLAAFPHEEVIAAAGRTDLTVNQLEGAARFFCRWIGGTGRKRRRRPIPADVRARLWAYVKSTRDEGKMSRAERIFAGAPDR